MTGIRKLRGRQIANPTEWMNTDRPRRPVAHDKERWVAVNAVTIFQRPFCQPLFRVDAHFDHASQVGLHRRGREILAIERPAVRAPVGVEIDHERNVELTL